MIITLVLFILIGFETTMAMAGMPREEILALNMILVYLLWWGTVFMSFFESGRIHPIYVRFFGTNNIRTLWLAGFSLLFFFACISMGWGQPIFDGVAEEISTKSHQVTTSEAVKRSQSVAGEILTPVLKRWDLYNNEEIVESAKQVAKTNDRKHYGLLSWTHWFVFGLFFMTTIVYGIFAWREESITFISAWIKRRSETQAKKPQAPSGGQQSPTTTGTSLLNKPMTLGGFLTGDILLEGLQLLLRLLTRGIGR